MAASGARWEHFEHESDIGVRGTGPTPASAFEQAALALTAVVTDLSTIETREVCDVECVADDLELLLVAWLDALIYQMAVAGRLFARFEVRIEGARLTARCHGEALDVRRHEPAVEIKGATLCALEVASTNGQWIAQCVVDV